MKAFKIFLYACLFLIIGEILIRVDKPFDLLNNAPKKISVQLEETDLLKSVEERLFKTDSNQFRILILGDSYIHGGGIPSSEKFSKKLSILLNENNNSDRNYLVLDVSRPSNNSLDNYNSFIYYEKIFKPHLVFWAYNFNDILGGVEITNKVSNESSETKTTPKRTSKETTRLNKFTKQVYSYSELLRYISANVQKELKTYGIVLPIGDFHYLTKKAYLEKSKDWNNTKSILSKTSQICQLNQSEFILYKMPEFNLLDKNDLFSVINESLLNYCDSNSSIKYIDGNKDFNGLDGNDFKLSKYDGHPNEKAHLLIANSVFEHIKNELSILNKKH